MNDFSRKLILTAKEVKSYLNISSNAVYELLRTKKIHSVKIGKKYLITMSAVNKFLESES